MPRGDRVIHDDDREWIMQNVFASTAADNADHDQHWASEWFVDRYREGVYQQLVESWIRLEVFKFWMYEPSMWRRVFDAWMILPP